MSDDEFDDDIIDNSSASQANFQGEIMTAGMIIHPNKLRLHHRLYPRQLLQLFLEIPTLALLQYQLLLNLEEAIRPQSCCIIESEQG